MNRIYRQLVSVDDWRIGLGDPEKHWRTGYSARALAYSWSESAGWPAEIAALWQTSPDESLKTPEPLLMLSEHKVKLPGVGADSQNDLFVLAKANQGLVSLAVEGKVDESFGSIIAQWRGGPDFAPNKKARFDALCGLLGLPTVPDTIRYQLLHRTASAMLEAQRYTAAYAVMIVHSFSTQTIDKNWDDFAAFVSLYQREIVPGQLVELGMFGGIRLFIGWAKGDPRYLNR